GEFPGHVLSQIESGKIGLPSADVRRRLAIAMGVTHVDLLLAAGELSDADIQVAGIEGVAIDTPEIEDLVDDLRAVHLTNKRVRALKGVIALMRESDQHLLSDPANGLPVAQMTGSVIAIEFCVDLLDDVAMTIGEIAKNPNGLSMTCGFASHWFSPGSMRTAS